MIIMLMMMEIACGRAARKGKRGIPTTRETVSLPVYG